MLQLENRVALVTGGAAGIGLACSRALATEGAAVVIADFDDEAAERAANEIRSAGGQAMSYKVDVSTLPQLGSLFDFIDKTYGRLHILFNHAGVQGPIGLDITEEQFDRVIGVNLKSHFFATGYALRLMRPCAPRASIVYTSSTSGLRASTRSPLYGTTKAGVLMLMRSVARQLGPERIRANAICPGPTDTAFAREFANSAGVVDESAYQSLLESSSRNIPLGRVAQPTDVAGVAVFLASDQSMYLTGVSIAVDGGLTA